MKAFSISNKAKIHIYSNPVSMSYGFPRLSELVQKKLQEDPTGGNLFLFFNKKFKYVKVLYHDHGGMCLFSKKLEKGKFDIEGKSGMIDFKTFDKLIDQIITENGKKRFLKVA